MQYELHRVAAGEQPSDDTLVQSVDQDNAGDLDVFSHMGDLGFGEHIIIVLAEDYH